MDREKVRAVLSKSSTSTALLKPPHYFDAFLPRTFAWSGWKKQNRTDIGWTSPCLPTPSSYAVCSSITTQEFFLCFFFFLLFSKRPDTINSGSAAGIQQGKRRKHLSSGLWLALLILHLNTRPAEMDARHSLGSGSQHCWGGSALKSHTANTWYY